MEVLYEVHYKLNSNYKNEDDPTHVYIGLNNNKHLLFNELIQVNPHNIHIVKISASYYNELSKYNDTMCIYFRRNMALESYIIGIKQRIFGRCNTMDTQTWEELLHVVDLWLTKFVPYK